MKHLTHELKEFQSMIHATARAKGFYKNPLGLPAKIALAHSELSEALEADRSNIPGSPANHSRRALIAEELADCIIRILDMAEAHKLPVVEQMILKAEFNKTRPMLHGGKLY